MHNLTEAWLLLWCLQEYEALPVEEFGKALLRGLGWSDGQGVGRKRQVVEPKQVIRRPDRLGLGANPAAPPPDKRPRKMGEPLACPSTRPNWMSMSIVALGQIVSCRLDLNASSLCDKSADRKLLSGSLSMLTGP